MKIGRTDMSAGSDYCFPVRSLVAKGGRDGGIRAVIVILMAVVSFFLLSAPAMCETGHVLRSEQRAELVLVFVHGVLGDGMNTWKNRDTEAYWPELVKTDSQFQDVDVYVYEYPSPLLNSAPSVDEVAAQLHVKLETDGVLDYPEIAFVAHSMGGIIVRAFLLRADDVAERARFLFFLGTPTLGSSVAKIGNLISGNPQIGQIASLTHDSYLADQMRAWLASSLRTLASYCAYEIQKTKGLILGPVDIYLDRWL